MQSVTATEVSHARLQLRAIGVLTAAMVFKDGIQFNAIQLAAGVLVNAADPDVSDILAFHVTCFRLYPI